MRDSHEQMMDIPNSSKSILDQVDDYLHDKDQRPIGSEHDESLDENRDPSSLCTTSSRSPSADTNERDSSEWIPESMQVDLDHLSQSLFIQNHTANDGEDDEFSSHNLNIPRKSSKTDFNLVRPEMVFSPMVSPMVMPTRSTSVGTYDTPFLLPQNASVSASGSEATATPFMNPSITNTSTSSLSNLRSSRKNKHNSVSQFSPLSSPALTAIDQAQIVNFALPEATITSLPKRNSTCSSLRSKKKSTANSTTSTNSKIVKNSPRLNPSTNSSRRQYTADHFKNNSPVINNDSHTTVNGSSWDGVAIFKLPESSVSSTDNNSKFFPQGINNEEPEPKSSSSGGTSSSPNSRLTPVALMNYPKVILPSTSKNSYRYDESRSPKDIGSVTAISSRTTDNDNKMVLRATESPVIKPKMHHHQDSQVAEQWNGVKSNTNPPLPRKSDGQKDDKILRAQSSCDAKGFSNSLNAEMPPTAVQLTPSSVCLTSGNGSSDDGELSKKQVHKVAEQGRRNRLNTALNDLNSLLPPELKDSVTIPSKATTVELACEYIRHLMHLLDSSKKNKA